MAATAAPTPSVPVPTASAPAARPPIPPTAPPAPEPLTGEANDISVGFHEKLRVRDWRVQGASKVAADAEVGFASLQGTVTVGGTLRAAEVTSKGVLSVSGKTEVRGPLAVTGHGEFGAELRANDLTSFGTLAVRGNLTVLGVARLSGRTEVAGALGAGTIKLNGSLEVRGPVSADRIEGELWGPSRVDSIRAGSIDLSAPRFPPWKPRGQLYTFRIEATEVRLEGVTVEFLKADRIVLGPHCQVSRLEGEISEQHRTAYVGPEVKSEILVALSR
jgi:cytoskeletal protein CcmA (bactofilin family)